MQLGCHTGHNIFTRLLVGDTVNDQRHVIVPQLPMWPSLDKVDTLSQVHKNLHGKEVKFQRWTCVLYFLILVY